MIALFDSQVPPNKLAVTYGGLTMNSPSDVHPINGGTSAYIELEHVMPHTQYATISDERPKGDGLEIYESRKISKALRIIGRIIAPSQATLYDKVEQVARTFDPALISFNNAVPNDFLALDFSVPTADTTNWATGYMTCRYYARPLTTLETLPGKYSGFSLGFILDLMLSDPRRYAQSTASISGSATGTNIGDYPSHSTITITATGAGSATYSIRNTATSNTTTLTLDLSTLTNGDVVTITSTDKKILKNGSLATSLFKASVSGNDYFQIEPGSNVLLVSNGTNVTTSTVYRPAWSL